MPVPVPVREPGPEPEEPDEEVTAVAEHAAAAAEIQHAVAQAASTQPLDAEESEQRQTETMREEELEPVPPPGKKRMRQAPSSPPGPLYVALLEEYVEVAATLSDEDRGEFEEELAALRVMEPAAESFEPKERPIDVDEPDQQGAEPSQYKELRAEFEAVAGELCEADRDAFAQELEMVREMEEAHREVEEAQRVMETAGEEERAPELELEPEPEPQPEPETKPQHAVPAMSQVSRPQQLHRSSSARRPYESGLLNGSDEEVEIQPIISARSHQLQMQQRERGRRVHFAPSPTKPRRGPSQQ